MTDSVAILSAEAVLKAIYAQRHARRVIWTASIILERLDVARYPEIPKHQYAKAKRILASLWAEGTLIRRVDVHKRFTMCEIAYMRPSDRPDTYCVPCSTCGGPQVISLGVRHACEACNSA
jgi:hypothetical protein